MFALQKPLANTTLCYNYGTNLNELPNYLHLNHFLVFLQPDLNNIFSASFVLLNSYLIMLLFEYDKSTCRQLVRGLFYFCACNFLLFSLWLFTMNTSIEKASFLRSLTSLGRTFAMQTSCIQTTFAHLRFVTFFFVYIAPNLAVYLYLSVCLVYYMHTRSLFFRNKKLNKKLLQQKKLKLAQQVTPTCGKSSPDSTLTNSEPRASPVTMVTTNSNTNLAIASPPSTPILDSEVPNRTSPLLPLTSGNVLASASSSSINSQTSNNLPPIDLDLEIGVYELINQINGLTTIWLQSSTHADRLIAELPTIEFCKCFYAHTIKIKALDETDRDTTTEDDEDSYGSSSSSSRLLSDSSFCECEKNKDLRKYFEESNFKTKV